MKARGRKDIKTDMGIKRVGYVYLNAQICLIRFRKRYATIFLFLNSSFPGDSVLLLFYYYLFFKLNRQFYTSSKSKY